MARQEILSQASLQREGVLNAIRAAGEISKGCIMQVIGLSKATAGNRLRELENSGSIVRVDTAVCKKATTYKISSTSVLDSILRRRL